MTFIRSLSARQSIQFSPKTQDCGGPPSTRRAGTPNQSLINKPDPPKIRGVGQIISLT